MSNRICLVETKFIGKDGNTSNGFRMYDNYDKTYNNMVDDLGLKIPDNNLEFLSMVVENFKSDDMAIRAMIDFIKEEPCGIDINGTWYDFDEIKEYI